VSSASFPELKDKTGSYRESVLPSAAPCQGPFPLAVSNRHPLYLQLYARRSFSRALLNSDTGPWSIRVNFELAGPKYHGPLSLRASHYFRFSRFPSFRKFKRT